jgi:4-azaleucine resistance transporter AzlC
LRGLRLALPIILGYLPVSFAFGVLGNVIGMPVWATIAMSLFVYAGSSQFAALQLLSVGAAPYAIVLTTFVINLRHMLLAASIAPNLRGLGRWELSAFSFELTDEAFAMHAVEYASGRKRPRSEIFTFNASVHASWILGTVLGVVASGLIGDVEAFGLDYALPAMFIALLVSVVKDRPTLLVALLGGGLAVGLTVLGLGYWAVLLATAIAATVGALGEWWASR